MLRSFDENSLREPDWSQKPVVVIAGDAPDTDDLGYRELLRFLQVHQQEMEIVWIRNSEGISHIAIPNTGSTHHEPQSLSVPLIDFSFSQSIPEGDQLEKLRTLSTLRNPPVIVIGLSSIVPGSFYNVTLVVRKPGKRNKFTQEQFLLEVQLDDPRLRFAIPYENFDAAFAYRASAHALLQAPLPWRWGDEHMDELKRFLVHDPDLTSITISQYRDHHAGRKKLWIENDAELIALIEASQDPDHQYSREEAAKLSELLRPMLVNQNLPEHLKTLPRHQHSERIINGEGPLPRRGMQFDSVAALVDYLGSYLEQARLQKMELLMGKDPSRIAPAIQAEIDAKQHELTAILEQVEHARTELAEATEGKRTIDAEIAKTLGLISEQYGIIRAQTDGLQSDIARFSILSREVATFRTEDISELASALHEFRFIPETENPSGTLPLRQRVAREIFGSVESTATPVERLIATIKEHDELIAKIATAIRHDPQSQINLYDATFYFLAQRAIDVARLPVSPHLRTHSVPTTRMLKIAFDNASEQERNWFTSLDRDEVIQPDIAREMMIHIINAAAAEKLGDHLTMSYVAGILSRLTFDEDAVVLPHDDPAESIGIEQGSSSGALPVINVAAAAFQASVALSDTPVQPSPDQVL